MERIFIDTKICQDIKIDFSCYIRMKARMLKVNWEALNGASNSKKILHLRPNGDGYYICPIKDCLHTGFKSQRGLRKHINRIHTWYYYFDQRPDVSRKDALPSDENESETKLDNKKTALSLINGFGAEFVAWLENSCGGDKSSKESMKMGRRGMRYLEHCMGDNLEMVLTDRFVDYALGSPDFIISFLKYLKEDLKVQSSCALGYIKTLEELIDFRKISGVSDPVLRSFAISEVYVRRAKINLSRRKKIEYVRNLDVEQLIARDSWATIDEMEKVIPFHTPEFMELCATCTDVENSASINQLTFGTRFLITFMFLRIKCSRPMTFQFLTLEMFESAKKNGGFIDQTQFKTQTEYIFDTLVLSQAVINIMQSYIDLIRPRCNPTCDYIVVNSQGKQCQNLHHGMKLLVYDAIGKHINPTRWRQVIETESSKRLDAKDQATITKDQKHSSTVARISYVKRTSRDVAAESQQALKKLRGDTGEKHNSVLSSQLHILKSVSDSSSEPPNLSGRDQGESSREDVLDDSDMQKQKEAEPDDSVIDLSSDREETVAVDEPEPIKEEYDVEIKREDVRTAVKGLVNKKFTKEEDKFLAEGIKQFGPRSWSKILSCKDYKFNLCRTRDSLRMRAKTKNMI